MRRCWIASYPDHQTGDDEVGPVRGSSHILRLAVAVRMVTICRTRCRAYGDVGNDRSLRIKPRVNCIRDDGEASGQNAQPEFGEHKPRSMTTTPSVKLCRRRLKYPIYPAIGLLWIQKPDCGPGFEPAASPLRLLVQVLGSHRLRPSESNHQTTEGSSGDRPSRIRFARHRGSGQDLGARPVPPRSPVVYEPDLVRAQFGPCADILLTLATPMV